MKWLTIVSVGAACALAILKVGGYIRLSWGWVSAPLWVTALAVFGFVFFTVGYMKGRKK